MEEARSTFRTFLDNFSGNLQRESERKLAENKALTEYLQTPEGKRAAGTTAAGVASLLPIPGMKRMFGTRLMNMMKPPLGTTTKNPMEEVAARRLLEQQTNRRNFLRQSVGRDQSLIKANEAPSANYLKDLEELQRLEQLLK